MERLATVEQMANLYATWGAKFGMEGYLVQGQQGWINAIGTLYDTSSDSLESTVTANTLKHSTFGSSGR